MTRLTILVDNQTIIDNHLVRVVYRLLVPSRRCKETQQRVYRRDTDDLAMRDDWRVHDLPCQRPDTYAPEIGDAHLASERHANCLVS